MSGFIVIVNINKKPIDKGLIHSLTQSLKYHGPDKQKVWVDESIGLGHALLRTTDESVYESQPATIDEKVWIVCSARIDDRKNLIAKLGLNKKIDLKKTPDSKLILLAYRKWGENCLDYLIGDFTFVIWDKQKQKIFAAKDQLGLKQLYFTKKNDLLIISNNMNAILKHPDISNKFNHRAIGGFLLFGDHTWLDKSITMFHDIDILMPAHKLKFDLSNKSLTIKKYWSLPLESSYRQYKNESDYIEHFKEIFEEAVKDRLRTSSISISMSGGMDSTSIAAIVNEIKRKKLNQLNIKAFTAVYDRIHPCEERHYANQAASQLNIPIEYISGDNYNIFDPYILTTRPVENFTLGYSLEIQKRMYLHSRTYLTGMTADNLLAFTPPLSTEKKYLSFDIIYNIIKMSLIYGAAPAIGSGLMQYLSFMKKNKKVHSSFIDHYPKWLNPKFEKNENLKEEWDRVHDNNDFLHPLHPVAYKSLFSPDWSTEDIFLNPGVTLPEAMDPFFDIRVIKFVLSLPSLPWLYNKHLLRKAMTNKLPQSVIDRPKTALGDINKTLFQQPESKWVEKWKASEALQEYISEEKIIPFSQKKYDQETYLDFRLLFLDQWIKKII